MPLSLTTLIIFSLTPFLSLFGQFWLFLVGVFVHALFEVPNAFAHPFHQTGQAAATEEDQDDHQQDDHFSRSETKEKWKEIAHN